MKLTVKNNENPNSGLKDITFSWSVTKEYLMDINAMELKSEMLNYVSKSLKYFLEDAIIEICDKNVEEFEFVDEKELVFKIVDGKMEFDIVDVKITNN